VIAVRNACLITVGSAPAASSPRSSPSASSPRSASTSPGNAASPSPTDPYAATGSTGSGCGRCGLRTSVWLTTDSPWTTGSARSGPSKAAAMVRQSASVASE
jgi:hypothetical protein